MFYETPVEYLAAELDPPLGPVTMAFLGIFLQGRCENGHVKATIWRKGIFSIP